MHLQNAEEREISLTIVEVTGKDSQASGETGGHLTQEPVIVIQLVRMPLPCGFPIYGA
jgi:hypothetical protein